MSKIRFVILTVLASLPLGLIAFAAKASAQDSLDNRATEALRKAMESNRNLLFPKGSALSSVSEAMERFKSQTNINENDFHSEFWKLVDEFENSGMLQRHGEYLLSRTPSIH